MSKAEEFALKALPKEIFNDEMSEKIRIGITAGYEQAEQDLALTWTDIPTLIDLTGKTFRWYCDNDRADVPLQELYEEVLRRFNEQRNRQ